MTPLIDQILALKTEAKNQRDRGGARGYSRALERLAAALKLATDGLAQAPDPDLRQLFARELADCHGIVGGIERRWAHADAVPGEDGGAARVAHLVRSCQAYDAGAQVEWDERYDIRNTYNLVNRLVSRLLLEPAALDSGTPSSFGGALVPPLNLHDEMAGALARIDQHLARQGNYWAEADLALLRVLLGQADAATAYAPFLALQPPAFAFTSALFALRPLTELPVAAAPALRAAVALLEAQQP